MERERPYESRPPARLKKACDFVVCWLVLLRAKLFARRGNDSRIEQCLELKKGTRFRLNGGRVELLEEQEIQSARAGVDGDGKTTADSFSG